MSLRKSSLRIIITVFVVCAIGLLGRFLYFDAVKVWADEASWQSTPYYKVPPTATGVNYSTKIDKDGQIISFETPYCTLYKSEVKGNAIEYSCTLISPQILELDGNVKTFSPTQDIVFTFTNDVDPLPETFLGVDPIDVLTLQIAGEEPKSVALSFEISLEKPNMTFVRMAQHYVTVKLGKKEKIVTKLLSWKIDDAASASVNAAGGKDKYIENWRTATIAEIRRELVQHHADTLTGQSLLNAVRDVFQYQNSKCSFIEGKTVCDYEYSSNGATALVFYLYSEMESKSNDSLYLKIADAVKMYTYPFYLKYNPTYKLPTAAPCPSGQSSCISDFQQASTFQYSSCPIENVVRQEWDSPQVTYFTDYISLRKTHPAIIGEKDILKELELVKTELDKGGFPDVPSATKLNQICYSLILSKSSNDKIWSAFKAKYYAMLLNKITQGHASAYIDQETGDFDTSEFLVTQISHNTYTLPFVSDSSVIYARDFTKLETIQNQIDNKSRWGNVPLSFALSYLYLAQHE